MAGYDVLLIEDDPDLCELMESHISESGYTIMTAENGIVAQDLMRNNQFRMIISDIKIPNRNGLQLAALARGSRNHSRVPIVLISGHVDEKVAMRARELNIVDLLVKPFNNIDLLNKIKSYLRLPEGQKINPLYKSSFEAATKSFLDDYFGDSTLITQKNPVKEWGNFSEISTFTLFNNGEITGEIILNTHRKIVNQLAIATLNCSESSKDDDLTINMTVQIMRKFTDYFTDLLKKNGLYLETTEPKVQLNHQKQNEEFESLICIPFSSGEKACRIDFLIKRKPVATKQQNFIGNNPKQGIA